MNIKKTTITLMLSLMFLFNFPVYASTRPQNWENKWWCDGVNWTYIVNNEPVKGYNVIDNQLYYFDDSGNEVIGWGKIENDWIYCRGEKRPISTGWEYINGVWYYFTTDGKMVSNTSLNIDGKTYSFGSDGAWIK